MSGPEGDSTEKGGPSLGGATLLCLGGPKMSGGVAKEGPGDPQREREHSGGTRRLGSGGGSRCFTRRLIP